MSWHVEENFTGCTGYAIVDDDAKALVACCATLEDAVTAIGILVKADEVEDAWEDSQEEDTCDCPCHDPAVAGSEVEMACKPKKSIDSLWNGMFKAV